MKTVFITSFHPLVSRNILATPVVDLLLRGQDTRLVIIAPEEKKHFFRQEFANENVVIEGVSRQLAGRDLFLRYLALAGLATRSLAIKRQTELEGSGEWLALLTGQSRFWRKILRGLDALFTPRGRFSVLISRYCPDLIFSTDVQNENDVRLMREGRASGIPIAGMVRSWDNLTAKGLIRIFPDVLAVNNEIVKREAVELHGVPENRLAVVGIPHYDRYLGGPAHSRQDFLETYGLPDKKFVVYAPAGDRYLTANTVDREIIEHVAVSIPATHHLLVRLPPADSVNLAGFRLPGNVTVIRPGRQLGRDPNVFKDNELTREDDDLLRDTLFHSELVIAGPSTICIDAAVFNKPIILIGFDGKEDRPYLESIVRYYDYDHMRPIVISGGARLVRSPEELGEWIGKYIKDPQLDAAGRHRIREEQCWKLDGRSSQRLAQVLMQLPKVSPKL